ncbi:MAG: ABC transporter substrate-binding protein [Myxococcales bacterium]|nr:ABC transporter substrate-binding protein [Myxococcales bacterium]
MREVRTGGSSFLQSSLHLLVGQAWTRGWELYWDKVNADGGIRAGGKTRHVHSIAADSKFDAEASAQSAKKLIYKDGATFVYGELTNAAASAIEEVSSKEKVLALVPWLSVPGGDGDVSLSRPYVVRPFVSPTDSWQMDYDYPQSSGRRPSAWRSRAAGERDDARARVRRGREEFLPSSLQRYLRAQ